MLVVKNLPANAEGIRDVGLILGWENPLEEGMATHSSIPAWRIPWTEEPGGLQSIWSQRVRNNWGDLAHLRWYSCCSVAQLCPILCDPMDCNNARFPCPSSPGAWSNACPLSRWCHLTFCCLLCRSKFLICIILLLLELFFSTTLHSLQDLSSLTRNWTWARAMKAPSPNHWSTREFS